MLKSLILSAGLVLTTIASPAFAEIKLKVATDSGSRESPSGMAIANWAKAIEEGTNGEIDVTVFYQNELGGQLEVFDMFVGGEIDLMLSWPSTSYDKRIGILYAPYMVTSWEGAFDAYKPGGWTNEVLNAVFGDLGLTYFGAWPEGFGGVATRGKYARDLESAKGIKVRTPPVFPLPQTLQAMGYQTAAIDWGEVYTSIQTGVVDGDAGNVIYWDYEYFRDLLDYYVRTKHAFVTGHLLANSASLEQLTEEQIQVIEDAAVAEMQAQFENARTEDEKYVKLAVESGMEYFELSDDEIAPIKAHVRDVVWTAMEAEVGKDLIDLMRSKAN